MARPRYTTNINCRMTEQMIAAIKRDAAEEGCADADVIRECVEAELPRRKERRRKRGQRAA